MADDPDDPFARDDRRTPSGAPGNRKEQVAADIRRRIVSGELEPNQPIPSEESLRQYYGRSRGTIRAACEILEGEGFIFKERVGRFVSPRNRWPKASNGPDEPAD